jgi:small ligand-binding sensory domain FIST
LSGVAFGPDVGLVSRVTQGAQPVDRERNVTAADGNLVLELNGEPALDVLLRERVIALDKPDEAMPRLRATLVGLTHAESETALDDALAPSSGDTSRMRGQFGTEVMVRHLIGLDPGRRGIAIADVVPVGTRLAFCERNAQAARADLVRVCAEVREELEPEEMGMSTASALGGNEPDALPHPARRIAGAIYVSCAGRGGPHFGSPSAELQTVRRALGDVPLVGYFAGGEIAHHRLYGYTGVLTVFTMPSVTG